MNLSNEIMNLPCERTMSHFLNHEDMQLYKEGHRDARHAAAELVLLAEESYEIGFKAGRLAALEDAATICDGFHREWRIGDASGPKECAEAIRKYEEKS